MRHFLTPSQRQAALDTVAANRGATDRNEAQRTIDAMSRMFGAQDAHRDQAARRAQQNLDALQMVPLDRAIDAQPHAFESGLTQPARPGHSPESPVRASTFPRKAA